MGLERFSWRAPLLFDGCTPDRARPDQLVRRGCHDVAGQHSSRRVVTNDVTFGAPVALFEGGVQCDTRYGIGIVGGVAAASILDG